MAKARIWGGGPYHPFRLQGEKLTQLLKSLGHQGTYSEDRRILDGEGDLLVLMGLDCSGAEKVSRESWEDKARAGLPYSPLDPSLAQSLASHMERGKPLLLLHAGLLSFDERKELAGLYDGRWILDKSHHPPLHEFQVRVLDGGHPICEGVRGFEIEDELYCDLIRPRRSTVLLEADWQGKTQPLAWCRETEFGGRFVYIALGHDMRAWNNEALETLQLNALNWLLTQ